jgi:IS5 family transposase
MQFSRWNPGSPSCRRRKRGTQKQGLGRSRGGFTTKLHARTNREGLPLGFVLTGGEAHDVTAYDELMGTDEIRPQAMLADKGYDSDDVRADCCVHRTNPIIPTKLGRPQRRTRISLRSIRATIRS